MSTYDGALLTVFNPGYAGRMTKSAESLDAPDLRAQAIRTSLHYVPKGKVISYSALAAYAGFPGNARYVGKLLGKLPKDTTLPWHRVLRADGKIAFPLGSAAFEKQKSLLEIEGITVTNGRVSVRKYGWQPQLTSPLLHGAKQPRTVQSPGCPSTLRK